MTSLADKLQDLELCLKSRHGQSHVVGYGRALRKAILQMDLFLEAEIFKSLGDLHLKEGMLSKDSAELDKVAAMYTAALLRCNDSDIRQTLEHRIGYMEKLSRQLLQGYTPQYQSLDSWSITDINVLRVAETCEKLDRSTSICQPPAWQSVDVETVYTEALVTAVENRDVFLEIEILKSLGDLYIKKGREICGVSEFSKAATMYGRALTICRDPGVKQTLHHRVLYTVKIWGAIRMRLESKKSRQRERRSPEGHQVGENSGADVHPGTRSLSSSSEQGMATVAGGGIEEERLRDSKYKGHLKKGKSSLAKADLISAEHHFAAALKTVHISDPTAEQCQREVEPLCKLGDVYSKRGQQTGDGGDFVKAAALYNAAIVRSKNQVLIGNIVKAIEEVEKSFLKSILRIHSNVSHKNTNRHKKQLKEMRDQIKLEMETIDQQLDPYVHDEDDPCVKDIEARRAQAVRQLFERIARERKGFISQLVEECIGLMGPPPCKYALIGLGSQATGLVTPYSDLEFAILLEDESERCVVYFRNLTHYLHLKVVNLGETILPSVGIETLNNFHSGNPVDNWFYDSITPRGFAFDGSMPKASKTPLGRQETMNKPSSELICTPKNMVSKLLKDVTLYLKEGYHLATILRNPCLIAGDQKLISTYMAITRKILQADRGKIAQQLAQETLRENYKSCNFKETITAKMIDVKKTLYRFPAVAVDYLSLSVHIVPTTVWETIEEMKNKQAISDSNAHHLTVLASISAELRLKTYIANGGQKEKLSAMASMETMQNSQESYLQTNNHDVQTNALKLVFYLPNEKQLLRYYHTAVPLKRVLSAIKQSGVEWSGMKKVSNSFPEFYDSSPKVQAEMYFKLCKYRQAISYLNEALNTSEGTETEEVVGLLNSIGHASLFVGDHDKAISFLEQALKMHEKITEKSTVPSTPTSHTLGSILSNLGLAWGKAGDHRKEICYLEQTLQIERNTSGQSEANSVIAISLANLGSAWYFEGDFRKAISYYEQAQQAVVKANDESSPHIDISSLLGNLGEIWGDLGEHRKSVSYHEQALQMNRRMYGQHTAHPDIALSLGRLGKAFYREGDYRKAISYNEQGLQMYRAIYGEISPHPDISKFLNILGLAWEGLGEHRRAISYHEQALTIRRRIYGQSAPHPDIGESLNNMGSVWHKLGDFKKSKIYSKQALKIYMNVYGPTSAHPFIIPVLNSIGYSLISLNKSRKAIPYFDRALHMLRINGQSKTHPVIATVLNNLGQAWGKLGEHRRAVCYHEQAIQMIRSIYGQQIAHPDIATYLCNLGLAYQYLSDFNKAIKCHEEALKMFKSVYGPQTAHPLIAILLNNLGIISYKFRHFRAAKRTLREALAMAKRIHPQDQNHQMIKVIEMGLASLNGKLHTTEFLYTMTIPLL
ncbi:uncharacterized protein LOC118408746 [Branchiostoma floridae]|uniref:Uncharacterized protein LOC118408746 n=1 Tax=Branchiostoma floridae TaxID=7739 RepID=A0A9J7HTB6_BRAFL|nr:uncharacterized protein LOC118408746 [Branchiostoma floridae]